MVKKILVIGLCLGFCLSLPVIIFIFGFQTTYQEVITKNLNNIENRNQFLSRSLVYSIIKAESNFDKNAKSSKDAFGLMQLTYSTAKEMAEKNDFEIGLDDLYNPDINIFLGIKYLEYLFSIFNDKNYVIIAYNAGPNRLKSWLENEEVVNETNTPFEETNIYLKKVLQYEKIYQLKLGEK